MNPTDPTDEMNHGPGLHVAQGALGAVTAGPCGVVPLRIQYLSLRLQGSVFLVLAQKVVQAQARLDRFGSHPMRPAPVPQRESDAAWLTQPAPDRLH